jgi:hypothetical protein
MPQAAPRTDRSFRIAFVACSAAALVPIWSVKYLPMVDLPQHAAQVAAWLHLGDPATSFGDVYELHLFVPYLLPYLLGVAVAKVAGVLPALKVLVSIAVLGLPLATTRLVLRRGGDPWWTLWCFPLAFGLPFYWGFVPFLVAVPLAILFVDEGDAYASAPTVRRGVALAALGGALFFSHLLALLPAFGAVALVIVRRAREGGRWQLLRLAPLLPSVAAGAAWVALAASENTGVQYWEWHFRWSRLTLLPQAWFDFVQWGTYDKPDVDHGAAAMTIALTAAVALSRPRLSRDPADWIPAAAAFGAYLLGPSIGFQGFLLSERMAYLILPLGLAALRKPAEDAWAPRAITLAAALGWMVVLTTRFVAFDGEMAVAERVWRYMEPNRRLTSLVFVPESKAVRSTFAFLHVAAWAHAEKSGVLDSAFATFRNVPIQYRPGRRPDRTSSVELYPSMFDWATDGKADYFLVKSPPAEYALTSPPVPLVLVASEGEWRLFRRLPTLGAAPR